MSYYTTFNVEYNISKNYTGDKDELIRALVAEFAKVIWDCDDINDPEIVEECEHLKTWGSTRIFEDDIKWYDWREDMEAISKKFPDVYFVITAYGEERDDNWRAYIHDGAVSIYEAMLDYGDDDATLEVIHNCDENGYI